MLIYFTQKTKLLFYLVFNFNETPNKQLNVYAQIFAPPTPFLSTHVAVLCLIPTPQVSLSPYLNLDKLQGPDDVFQK